MTLDDPNRPRGQRRHDLTDARPRDITVLQDLSRDGHRKLSVGLSQRTVTLQDIRVGDVLVLRHPGRRDTTRYRVSTLAPDTGQPKRQATLFYMGLDGDRPYGDPPPQPWWVRWFRGVLP